MSILIDKAGVRQALEDWFIAARAGETLSARETAELSSHDAAAASSDFFYDLLVKQDLHTPAPAPEPQKEPEAPAQVAGSPDLSFLG